MFEVEWVGNQVMFEDGWAGNQELCLRESGWVSRVVFEGDWVTIKTRVRGRLIGFIFVFKQSFVLTFQLKIEE